MADVAAELSGFGAPADLATVLDDAVTTGLLAPVDDGRVGLTEAGRRRLEQATPVVAQARTRVSAGVTAAAYRTTIDTLATMCRNLEGPPS